MSKDQESAHDGAHPREVVFGSLLLVFFTVVLISSSSAQEVLEFSFQVDPDDAFPDSTIPAKLLQSPEFDWEDPTASVSVDLNGDGQNEKLIPDTSLRGTGGCPWLIVQPSLDRAIGRIDAIVMFIRKSRPKRYATIEGYVKLGADRGILTTYDFNGKEYVESKTIELTAGQIDKYFQERNNVPHPKRVRPGS